MTRKFTGTHMLMIVIAFFAVVISVNVVMARYALSTFGGTVVDNSYVAGQHFNGWLAKARKQEALGWKATVARTADDHIQVNATASGYPMVGVVVSAIAKHPLGRAPDIALRFVPVQGGAYRSDRPLPAGRWQVHLNLRRGADEMRVIEQVG